MAIDTRARSLRKLTRLMKALRAGIDPTVPIQVVQTFLVVAVNEGTTLTDIASTSGANLSTVSRHTIDLGERNRRMGPGYGLIESRTDPMSLRTKNYSLSQKGRLFVDGLISTLED